MPNNILWLRNEVRETERRCPLLPDGAKALIDVGCDVVVERSKKRIFNTAAYEKAGCIIAGSGAWVDAPTNAIILGLKELPEKPARLKNDHIYFAHAFKKQAGWQDLLSRFDDGGGDLLDIEYMVDEAGRRVVAFGFWAGYMGAALALMQWYDRAAGRSPLCAQGIASFENTDVLDAKIRSLKPAGAAPRALVLGALGRGGKGALQILKRHGVDVTEWDQKETASLDREALLSHDILINCAFVGGKIPPFVRPSDVGKGCLRVITDVSCDPFSDFNPLPLYSAPTSWDSPFVEVVGEKGSLDLFAIDNLPSLLPKESSVEFAGLLLPFLKELHNGPVWEASRSAFHRACKSMNKHVTLQ
ncbi:MAG: saccharopine dehydrogenase [Kordiimonadaceae bacterium]|nr:saccharopine dehydrogenase [Kordiimonadaceae bacterium]